MGALRLEEPLMLRAGIERPELFLAVTEVETTPLLTMKEAIDSMHTAGKALGIYQPPRGSEKTG